MIHMVFETANRLLPLGAETLSILGEQEFELTLGESVILLVPGLGGHAVHNSMRVTAKADCTDRKLVTPFEIGCLLDGEALALGMDCLAPLARVPGVAWDNAEFAMVKKEVLI